MSLSNKNTQNRTKQKMKISRVKPSCIINFVTPTLMIKGVFIMSVSAPIQHRHMRIHIMMSFFSNNYHCQRVVSTEIEIEETYVKTGPV